MPAPSTSSAPADSAAGERSFSVEITDVLVAQDFTPFSRRALRSALLLAGWFGAQVHHVHVRESGSAHDEDEEALRAQLAETCEEVRSALAGSAADPSPAEDVDVVHEVVRGEGPAGVIVSYAYEHAADLVVLGTHGRRGLRRLLLGSVAEDILHRAPCPVLAVRKYPLQPQIGRILAPVDFSEHSMRALRHAREIASRHEAEVELLHVLKNLPTGHTFFPETDSLYYDYDPDIEDRARDRLRQLWTAVGGPEVAHTEHAMLGSPPSVIRDQAEEQNAHLIVMGTRGQTGAERFFLGSVADRVVRSAGPPVLVVRPTETAPLARVRIREEVLESDWYENQSEEDRELIRSYVGRSAEMISHSSEETRLLLDMVTRENRYLHVPNEYIVEVG